MEKLIKASNTERAYLFLEAAKGSRPQSTIIEKDFWVSWALNYLFNDFAFKDHLVFKGGTCLSKVYGVIERFSEDIDLALDWPLLDLTIDEAYEDRSNRQQDLFNKAINKKTAELLEQEWLPLLQKDFSDRISDDFRLWIDPSDPLTILFGYPRSFDDPALLQNIRLEFGVLAEPIPSEFKSISPMIAESFPELFDKPDFPVRTVDVHRTFFEKCTTLHREANRTNNNYPERYSRHFYDVYQLIKKGFGEECLTRNNILEMDVRFKTKFYPCNWAKYDEVLKGNMRLVGDRSCIEVFREDYDRMQMMIYGKCPSFDEIIEELKNYEGKINKVIKEWRSAQ